MVHTGPGLVSTLFVMSQIILVGLPLKIRLSLFSQKNYSFSNEGLLVPDILHSEAETFPSETQFSLQGEYIEKNTFEFLGLSIYI